MKFNQTVSNGTVVRMNDSLPLKETKLVRVTADEFLSISGEFIYPLGIAGQTANWLKNFISIVPESDYRPLINK